MKIGKNMKRALAFVTKYPGWHSWDVRCRTTQDTIRRLEKRGLIKTNTFGQFCLA